MCSRVWVWITNKFSVCAQVLFLRHHAAHAQQPDGGVGEDALRVCDG